MARLKEYNGHYCESEYEYAFIGFLETEGWKYTSGNKLSRVTKRDVLIEDDFKKFIADGNLDLTEDEVMSFWSDPKLYQKLTPNPDAVKVINELAAQGHNIIFLSMCKKGHFASKVQSSKEWFNIPPEQYGFLVTHEKHFADVDIIIDDRNRFLEAFKNKPEVIKIKIETPYSQDVGLSVSLDLETNDWNKIGEFINELGE